MALPPRTTGDSFLAGHGSSFPQQDVVIIHNAGQPDESTLGLRAHVQSKKAFFDVDAPVYEGDYMELDDPRGGSRRVRIVDVQIHDVRGAAGLGGMSHIEVAFSG
jgi:hypothetical protein